LVAVTLLTPGSASLQPGLYAVAGIRELKKFATLEKLASLYGLEDFLNQHSVFSISMIFSKRFS
jgi:hypothetical protein